MKKSYVRYRDFEALRDATQSLGKSPIFSPLGRGVIPDFGKIWTNHPMLTEITAPDGDSGSNIINEGVKLKTIGGQNHTCVAKRSVLGPHLVAG